jgi:excisionase family DNA binding protein
MAAQTIRIAPQSEEEAQAVKKLYRMLVHEGTAALVGPDNTRIDLPPALYEVLVQIVQQMQEGRSVALMPVMEELSTQAAADMLGVSRQFLVNELESGKLPFHRTGAHRKVYFRDLADYKRRRDQHRKEAIQRIAQESKDLGIYDKFIPVDDE